MKIRKATRRSYRMASGIAAALIAANALDCGVAAPVMSPAAQRGLTLVRAHCASCHSVDAVSESPLKIAPPFRSLHFKYPVDSLKRPLTEGLVDGHRTMPVFRFDPGQVTDIIAYLKAFEE